MWELLLIFRIFAWGYQWGSWSSWDDLWAQRFHHYESSDHGGVVINSSQASGQRPSVVWKSSQCLLYQVHEGGKIELTSWIQTSPWSSRPSHLLEHSGLKFNRVIFTNIHVLFFRLIPEITPRFCQRSVKTFCAWCARLSHLKDCSVSQVFWQRTGKTVSLP